MDETTVIESRDSTVQQEFSTPEAAEFLECSEGHLMNLRKYGGGPTFYRRWKRRGIYYLRPDLEKFRRGRRFQSTSEY